VTIRELFLENFAGDLEYHPRRALVYFSLSIAAACFWIFSPYPLRFTAIQLVFALGSVTLFVKGIFLLRRSSEGLRLSHQGLIGLSNPSHRKNLSSITAQAAQVFQDFGTGAFLLWPLLDLGKDIDHSWINPPRFQVLLSGAALFFLGWLIRRMASSPTVPTRH
jgi:hypothetical protein